MYIYVSEVGVCLSLRAQPGNRFVSFVCGATRRVIICTLGRFAPRTVAAGTAAAAASPRLCTRLLACGFWLLSFSLLFLFFFFFALVPLAFGFWLLCARALGFWLLAFLLLLLLRACALGFWLLAFVLAFGFWLVAFGFR